MTRQGWITVGVDDSDGSRAAIRWAAHEAQRVGAGLRLLHVFSDVMPMGALYASASPGMPIEGRRLAERTVRAAAEPVKRALKDVPLDEVVLRGDRRTGLLHAAAHSDLMVLGDVEHPARHRVITGSVIGPVAAHSPTPVVVVPADCHPDPGRGVVVAGVKFFAASHQTVRQAFEVAAAREARLVVLHAWEYSAPESNLLIEHADLVAWEERSAKELRQVVDEVSRDFPGVEVEVRFVRGQPAKVLAEASADSDLITITRRVHGFPFGHLGAAGRAVLRETRCPAMVLPPTLENLPMTVPGDRNEAAS